jgi:glycosyltransferase involved in cell wall biosynthesis
MKERKPTICEIIAVRNEAHYLQILLPILAQQEIDVVIIDNESTDNSHELYSTFRGNSIVSVEQLPYRGYFSLSEQMVAKQSLYNKLEYDWLIHHDADEVLEHSKPGYTLRDAIEQADQNGYTALNFEDFTFLPEPGEDYFNRNYYTGMLRYYFLETRKNCYNRAWKRDCGLCNLSSGGHKLEGEGLRIDPTDHVLRHYPVLSEEQALKKYLDRSFDKRDLDRGWHGNRLNFTKKNLKFPVASKYLFKLQSYNAKDFCRDMPAVKQYWEWEDIILEKNQENADKEKNSTFEKRSIGLTRKFLGQVYYFLPAFIRNSVLVKILKKKIS